MTSPERLSHRSHNFFFFSPLLSFPFSLIYCIPPHPLHLVLSSPGQGDQLGLDRLLNPRLTGAPEAPPMSMSTQRQSTYTWL